MSLSPPSRAEVEQQFKRLLGGEATRDDDLPGWPDRDYLIEDEQVAEWLTELRESDHMP